MLLETIEYLLKRRKRLSKIFLFPLLVLVTHIILTYGFNIYSIAEWFDIPMHFIGGISMGASYTLFLLMIQKDNQLGKVNPVFFVIFVISLSAATAVTWEFLEFSSDYLFHTHMQPSLADTIGDLFLGILGGTMSCLLTYYLNKKN